MKWVWNIQLCSIVVASCATKTSSREDALWLTAKESKEMTCQPWPLGAKDLAVNRLTAIHRKPFGFQAEVRQRSGGRRYDFANYEPRVKIANEDLNAREFGNNAIALGVIVDRNEFFVVVLKNQGATGSTIEIRNLNTNVVLFSSNALNLQAIEGRIIAVRNGWWLDLHSSSTARAFIFISRKSGRFLITRPYFRQSSQEVIAASGRDSELKLFSVSSLGGNQSSVDNSLSLSMEKIDSDLKVVTTSVVLKTNESLESFSVNGDDDRFTVAYIDGDSLIGKATLRIARFQERSGQVQEILTRGIRLTDNHLAQPIVIPSGTSDMVLMTRWVDKEAVVSVYSSTSKEIKHLGNYGNLDPGSRVTDAFYDADNENLVLTVRTKKEHFWDFAICSIGVKIN